MEAPRIFISYRKNDINRLNEVREVRRTLQQDYNFETWLDEDLKGGDVWRNEINEKLNWANCFLLIVHSDIHLGNTVLDEIKFALQAVESGKYRNVVCFIVENILDDKYLKTLDDTLKQKFPQENLQYLHIRHYIPKSDPSWAQALETSFNPIVKEQQGKAINDAKKIGFQKLEKAMRIYQGLIYLLRPFSFLDKEVKIVLRQVRNKINICLSDEREILKILENTKIVVKTGNYILIQDDSFGRKAITEAFFKAPMLLNIDIVQKYSAKRIKSILSSLAEINEPDVKKKLEEYINLIKKEIITQNNDQRFESLSLLEKFAFRLPLQAIKIVELFSKENAEQHQIKYKLPFPYDGHHHKAILEKCLDILNQYNLRYGLFDQSLELLVQFYQFKLNDNTYENIRKRAKEIIINTAEYNLRVIQPEGYPFQGYRFQEQFLRKVKKIITNKEDRIFYLGLSVIEKLLFTELEGTYWDDKSFIIKFGPLIYTPKLASLRKKIIALVIKIMKSEHSNERKLSLIKTLNHGMHFPIRGIYSDELEKMIMLDIQRIVNVYSKLDFSKNYPTILQEIEKQLAFQKRRYANYKNNNKVLANRLFANLEKVLNRLRSDNFYKIYRTLVGDDIYLRDSDDDWEKIKTEKQDEVKRIAAIISINNIKQWATIFIKIADTYSLSQEYIFADFRMLCRILGKDKPELSSKIIKTLIKHNIASCTFLTDLVSGLRESQKQYLADNWVKNWLSSGDFSLIREIPYTYWLPNANLAKSEDVCMLERLTRLRLSNKDREELDFGILRVLPCIYKQNPSKSNGIILMILKRAEPNKLSPFVSNIITAGHRKQIEVDKLPKMIIKLIIQKYGLKDRIEYYDEYLIAFYAKDNPLQIIDFFKKRVMHRKNRKKDFYTSTYDAMPYHLGDIAKGVTSHAAYGKVIKKIIHEWILSKDYILKEEGKHLLHELSPLLDDALKSEINAVINSGDAKTAATVLDFLKEYHGASAVDELCKKALRIYKGNKEVKRTVGRILYSTGVVTGEYGLRDAYKQRLERIQEWERDKISHVRQFAHEYSESLKIDIKREEARVAEEEVIRKKGIEV